MIISPPTLPHQATGASFVASRRVIVATKFETPIAYFKATTKLICWNSRNSFCWVPDQIMVLSAYANPTITMPGQPQTPVNMRIGATNTATMTVFNDPAASHFGTYLASLKVATSPVSSGLLLVIDPGQSLLITATASDDNTDVGVGFSWFELDP